MDAAVARADSNRQAANYTREIGGPGKRRPPAFNWGFEGVHRAV